MATVGRNTDFCQYKVSTPQKKSNLEHEERDEYDVKANWELNEDNEESAENRCQEVKCLNLMRLLKNRYDKKSTYYLMIIMQRWQLVRKSRMN